MESKESMKRWAEIDQIFADTPVSYNKPPNPWIRRLRHSNKITVTTL